MKQTSKANANTNTNATANNTANNTTQAQRFNLKVQFVNTNHTTKFNMTVGEIYLRKDGQATAYAVGYKEPFANRDEAMAYVRDKITEFCKENGFGVEFKDVTPAPIETVEV